MVTDGIAVSLKAIPFYIHYYAGVQMNTHLLNACCV